MKVSPERPLAVVIGIEHYTGGSTWALPGAALDAARFAHRLVMFGVPAASVIAAVAPLDVNRDEVRSLLGQVDARDATFQTIRDILVDELPALASDLLLIYWGGHGVIDRDTRRLLAAEATLKDPRNFDFTHLRQALQSDFYVTHPRQLIIVDTCQTEAVWHNWRNMSGEKIPLGEPRHDLQQHCLIAASPGQAARNDDLRRSGVFSSAVLELLTWPPDTKHLAGQLHEQFIQLRADGKTDQVPFSATYVVDSTEDAQLYHADPPNLLQPIPERPGRVSALTDLADIAAATEISLELRRSNDFDQRAGYVDSGASATVMALRTAPWIQIISDLVTQVAQSCVDLGGVDDTIQRLRQAISKPSFDSVHRALRDVDFADITRQLRRSQAKTNSRSVRGPAGTDLAKGLHALRQLGAERDGPHYAAALLCTGGLGSGRRRLVSEAAQMLDPATDLPLFIDGAAVRRDGLEDSVLNAASDSFAHRFQTVHELCAHVSRVNLERLWIFLEDTQYAIVDTANGMQSIQDTVSRWTTHRVIRWVITGDELSDDLVSGRRPEFWHRYGPQSEALLLRGGWLALSEINLAEQTGLSILRENASATQLPDIEQLIEQEDIFGDSHLLCSPLPAWLALTSGQGLAWMSDPFRQEFIDTYWDRLLLEMSRSDREQRMLHRLVSELAERLAIQPNAVLSSHTLADVIAHATSADVQLTITPPDVIAQLLRARLLCELPPDSTHEVCYATRQEPLWAHRVALHALQHLSPDGQAIAEVALVLGGWRDRASTSDRLAEAVVQFLVVLIWATHPDAATQLWPRLLQTDRRMLWLAGPLAPTQAQELLRRDLEQPGEFDVYERRDLFAFLRFCSLSTNDAWTAKGRLAVLARAYERIADCGLAGYLVFVVANCVTNPILCNVANHTQVLAELSDIERAGVAPTIVELMIAAAKRIFSTDSIGWLTSVVGYYRLSSNEQSGGLFQKVDSSPVTPFWATYARAVCTRLGTRHGTRAFDVFYAADWYLTEQYVDDVAHVLRTEANTAIGYRFRPYDRAGVEDYVSLINDLISTDKYDRLLAERRYEIAFHLLKHTVPTGKHNNAVRIHTSLHEVLHRLCGIELFRSRWGGAVDQMCAVNECPRLAGARRATTQHHQRQSSTRATTAQRRPRAKIQRTKQGAATRQKATPTRQVGPTRYRSLRASNASAEQDVGTTV